MLRSHSTYFFFFFNDTATTEIYTLSLHDALPILKPSALSRAVTAARSLSVRSRVAETSWPPCRSEEHTSELQSQSNLVCRLLLEKKKKSSHTNFDRLTEFVLHHAAVSTASVLIIV